MDKLLKRTLNEKNTKSKISFSFVLFTTGGTKTNTCVISRYKQSAVLSFVI